MYHELGPFILIFMPNLEGKNIFFKGKGRYFVCSKLLMIIYKCIDNIASSYLSKLLSQYSPTRTLRSGNKQLLQEAKSNAGETDHLQF